MNPELENNIFELFVRTISRLHKSSDIEIFLDDLLSPAEKTMLMKRLAIAILLTKGYTYDEIDQKLKVSRPTIMTVSYFLKNGRGGYKKVTEKVSYKEKEIDYSLIEKIEEILDSIPYKNKNLR